ncbi:MAG: glycerate kinase [Betaproteobacteria bacterium]|nr:glycerate kinase [Betaproteobacteria bacterium]
MLRVVIAPDSFKGSLSAPQVCVALARGLARVWPDVIVVARPMADGGEGTLDAVLAALGGNDLRSTRTVTGASGAPVVAAYGIITRPEGATAIIEIAQIIGITDQFGMTTDVGNRSTLGVGELVKALLDDGIRRFMVGLGGSSTNDAGAGMLTALGVSLLDAQGDSIVPTPVGLASLARVDASALDARILRSDIKIMTDVNNPLCGDQGATAIFGPQKGVADDDQRRFDTALAHFAQLAEAALKPQAPCRAADAPGAGAAGGLGFGLHLLGGTFLGGADMVADAIKLDAALSEADWAITGEGKSDRQTLLRKAPLVVAQRARAHGVRATLISGSVDACALPALSEHFAGCFALADGPMTLAECLARTAELLADRSEQAARVWDAAGGGRQHVA